jgi:hypothetical protein
MNKNTTNTTFKMSMVNGEARSNTGYRQVVFGPHFEMRPVIYRVYSGYQPTRYTVQVINVGDLLFRVEWGRSFETFSVEVVTGADYGGPTTRTLAETEAWPLWETLRKRFPQADDFIKKVKRGPSYLPTDIWPEDQDLSALAKVSRKAGFESRYGVELPSGVLTSPKAGLCYAPIDKPLAELLDLNPSEYSWDGSMVGIHRTTRYWWSNGRGVAMPAVPVDRVNYESGSNYAHEETTLDEPMVEGLLPPPKWARFLVEVCTGAYTSDHFSHGVKVVCYRIK